jgi:CRISPR-associated protein Cmr3
LQKSSTNDDAKAPAYRLLKPASEVEFDTEAPFDGWRPLAGGGEGYSEVDDKVNGSWLTEQDFKAYLQGKVDGLTLVKQSGLFETEDRVGLALDYKRRANAEGMFYRAEFTRPCDGVGLILQTNANMFPAASGYVNIGGESRSGRYEVLKNGLDPFPQTGEGNVRIILLTPAYFSGGWQPQGGDWSAWVGGGELVSLVLGKPHPISGWDVANNQPKPLRNYVPAGSVFFFKGANVTGTPFTETPEGSEDQGVMGFGTFAVGVW